MIHIWNAASKNASEYACLNRKTTVCESAAVTDARRASSGRASAFTTESRYTSKVNATSRAVTGWPSCQRALGLRLKRRVVGPSHDQESANAGTNPESPTVFKLLPSSASFENTISVTAKSASVWVTGGSSTPGSARNNTAVPHQSVGQRGVSRQAASATTAGTSNQARCFIGREYWRVVLAAPGPGGVGEGGKAVRR